MIQYTLAPKNGILPPTTALLQYVLAENGIYLRASRKGLDANIQVAPCEIRGVPPLTPFVTLQQRVPIRLLNEMLDRSRAACKNEPREILFHLTFDSNQWSLIEPAQHATSVSVRPVENAESTRNALIEIHSHHEMPARFSLMDDQDESSGFRIFGVLGNIFTKPKINLRIGIHGYFAPVALKQVFES